MAVYCNIMRLFFTVLASFTLFCSSAQVKIAARAGLTFSTAAVSVKGIKQTSSFRPGASLGIQFKVPFDGLLHFSPYAAYNMRSFKTNYSGSGAPGFTKQTTIHYLDLVPNLSIDIPVKGTNTLVWSFGPVFGFTNFGREKTTINNTTTSNKINFGYDGYGWFDLGVNTSIGYHFKKVFAEIGYYHGLAGINNKEEFDEISIRNRMFNMSFGYYLR